MNAKHLIDRMTNTYASCASYRDTGTVYVRGVPSGSFETEFVRSTSQFCFAFNADDGCQYLVRAEHGKLAEFRLPPEFSEQLRTPDGFGAAIATITGVTLGSGHLVPRLLMTGVLGGRSISGVSQPAILGEKLVSGETWAWIELGAEFPNTFVLVSKSDYTLRRVLVLSSKPTIRDPASTQSPRNLSELPNQEIAYEVQIV